MWRASTGRSRGCSWASNSACTARQRGYQVARRLRDDEAITRLLELGAAL
jgi:hypothetical protein